MGSSDYLNGIIYDLLDVIWEEHGLGARYRTTLVGSTYFRNKYGDALIKDNWRDTVDAVIEALKKEGLITDAGYEGKDNILNMKFHNCQHLDIERQLLDRRIKIISCPCAHVVMYFLDKLVGKHSEIATLDVEGSECTVSFCVMGSELK